MSKTSQSQSQTIQSIIVPTILKPLTSHDCEVMIARTSAANLVKINLRRDGDAQLIKLRRQLMLINKQITDIESQQSILRSEILQNDANIDALSTWSHELKEKDIEQNYIGRCYTYLTGRKFGNKGEISALPLKCISYDAFKFLDINEGNFTPIENLVSTEIIRLASYVKACDLLNEKLCEIKSRESEYRLSEDSYNLNICEFMLKCSTYGELFNSQSISRNYNSLYLGQIRGSSAWTLVDLEFVTLDTTHILEYRKL